MFNPFALTYRLLCGILRHRMLPAAVVALFSILALNSLRLSLMQRRCVNRIETLGASVTYDASVSDTARGYPLFDIVDLWHAYDVNASGTKRANALAVEIAQLSRVTTLSFADSDIDDAGIAALSSLSSVEFLNLSNTRVTDNAFVVIASFKKLGTLVLSNTKITDDGMRAFERHAQLRQINLDGTLITDEALKTVLTIEGLEVIDCARTGITNQGLISIGKARELTAVGLSGINIDDDGMQYLRSLKKLQQISLSRTMIGDSSVKYLQEMFAGRDSGYIDVSETQMSEAGLFELRTSVPQCLVYP